MDERGADGRTNRERIDRAMRQAPGADGAAGARGSAGHPLLDAVIGNLADALDRVTATPDDDGERGGGRDGRDGTGRTR